jgi:hypothetical protein
MPSAYQAFQVCSQADREVVPGVNVWLCDSVTQWEKWRPPSPLVVSTAEWAQCRAPPRART